MTAKREGHSLGNSEELQNNGLGIVFRVSKQDSDGSARLYWAFVIKVDDQLKGYLNVCAHAGLRLNGDSNVFFDRDGGRLYCRSHGASYEPDTGLCVHGPCKGLSLIKLDVTQEQGQILLVDEVYKFYE